MALAGLIVQFVCGIVAIVLARYSEAATVNLLAWVLFIGFGVWFFTLIHLRQSRRAHEEN